MASWNFTGSTMDLDFADRLNFLEPESFISSVLYEPAECSLHHQIFPGIQEHVTETTTSSVQSESSPIGACEANGRWLIDSSSSIKEKLMVAVEYLKDYVEDSDVLIQIWMPTKRGDQNVLTTIDQPYSLNPNCKGLDSYRDVSKSFHLTTEADTKESAGLPGRVFSGRFPEWTPDVRFFRSEECPRKYYAKMYNISGCLALPVFDQDSGICLAVVEIVTTTQKISYHLELEIVCKALEAVDLRSSHDFIPHSVKACNQICQIAVPEISEILQSICETYRLPLAETWALQDCQLENDQQQSPEEFDYCISTVDSACYVADTGLLGFHEACSEQYLRLNQGIVGKAFATNKQWFATDITSFRKTNYPLSHHARMFNLLAAMAIPLRNAYTGSVQLVLELFLPRDCKDTEQQQQMWNLLPVVVQQACRSYHVVMDKEIDPEINEQPIFASVRRSDDEGIQNFESSADQRKCGFISWECLKEEPEDEFKVITQWDNIDLDLYQEQIYSDFEQLQQSSVLKHAEKSSQRHSMSSRKAADKKQNKIEKAISLQILRQYFSGSLKDAAKKIGVCPTTLKRICRQHGIKRWPARKIKKVNHSLKKLQLVVNSIHGTEGLLQIDSFYKTFPELNSPIPKKDPPSLFKKSDNSNRTNSKPDSGSFNPKATDEKSQSSSSSQNSDSSICCSTEAKKLNCNGYTLMVEDPVLALKRNFREGELHSMNQTSHKNRSFQIEPQLPKHTTGFRVKASFGEEHVRFSLLPSWSFKDLQQEIAKRFKIDDFSRIGIKYIDIENEQILLTCDADLEECLDLLSFSHNTTIKISLHQACQTNQSIS